MEPAQKPKLEDILNYKPEEYWNESELGLIRNTFKYNPGLLKVLRKVFIPTIADPELPIEEMGKDVWMTGIDFQTMPVEEVKAIATARQLMVKAIVGGLVQLKVLANSPTDDPGTIAERRAKDSVR